MPTLQDIYKQFTTQRDTAQEDAFSQWVREQGDQANSFTSGELKQRWNELQNYDVNAGPGSVNTGRMERDSVLQSGFIPIDNDIAYAAKEFGITIPELMQKYFPGGQFVQSTGSNFSEGGGGDRYYYQANQSGTPIDTSILMSLPRVPSGSMWDLVKESGLPLIAGAFGAGMLGMGGAGAGIMPTAAGETAGLSALGSVTGGSAGLAGLGALDLSGLASAPYEGFNSELFPGATSGVAPGSAMDLSRLANAPYEGFTEELFPGATQGGLPPTPGGLPPGGQQAPAPVQNGPTNPGTGPGGSNPGLNNPLGNAPVASTAGSALQRLLEGKATAADYLELAGKAGSTALGVLGANSQTDAMKDIAEKNFQIGAPSRLRYEGSYAPGFTMANDPGYKDAIDASASAKARALSVTEGNPFHSPSAMDAINKHVVTSTALPALYNYRSQNINSGGMGLDMAGRADLGAAQAGGGIYDALGYGLSALTRPDNGLSTLAQLYKSLQSQRTL